MTPPDANALRHPELPPETTCINQLLHLAEVQPPMEARAMTDAGKYFTASTGALAPEDLTTRLVVYPKAAPEDTVTSVTIQFRSEQVSVHTSMQSLEIRETDHGVELHRKVWPTNIDESPRHTRLTDTELEALSIDAASIRSQIVAAQLARLQLGELVDHTINEEGERRFHVGDITSVVTGWSPRGEEGIHDLLHFMTGEHPHSSQLGRFIMEAYPSLVRQLPELEDFMPSLQRASQLTTPELYALVGKISGAIGDFKWVKPLNPSEHTNMGVVDEMELDGGTSLSMMTDNEGEDS